MSMLKPAEYRAAYAEGAATAVFRNLAGAAFIVPLALALGAGPLHIGLIGAAPFLGRLLQLVLARWAENAGARVATLAAGTAERLVILAVAALPFLLEPGTATAWLFVAGLVLAALYAESFNVAVAVWFAARVPLSTLGRFTAVRTQWANASALLAALLAAWLVGSDAGAGRISLILAAGALAGLLGIWVASVIRLQQDPVRIASPGRLRKNIAEAWGNARFRALTYYGLVWGFGVNMSAPFFLAYAAQELGFGVRETAILAALGLGVGTLFLPFWGRLTDRYGNRMILIGCGFWGALIPALWGIFVVPGRAWAALPIEVVAGCVWAGINLAAANLLLKSVPTKRRVAYISAFTAITGAAIASAPLLGGALISALTPHLGSVDAYRTLFVLSTLLRLPALLLLRKVPEDGSVTLARSVRVLYRRRPHWGTPAGMGTALLWVPVAAEAARERAMRVKPFRRKTPAKQSAD